MKNCNVAINLGSYSIMIFVEGKGLLQEMNQVSYDFETNEVKDIGHHFYIPRGESSIRIIERPFEFARENGKDDFVQDWMRFLINKVMSSVTTQKANIYLCVSSCVPEEETMRMQSIIASDERIGIVRVLDGRLMAAMGAGINTASQSCSMVVDIGGATTDIAVISGGEIMVSETIEMGGRDFDEAIIRHMRKKHNLLIGEYSAADIKIGSAYPHAEIDYMDVRGRNLVTGLPKTVKVSSEETEEALRETTAQIVEAIHSVLEKTPPELAADIADRGIVLTGGGALLRGLEDLIASKTGINTVTAEDPMTAVAVGTGRYVEFLAGYHDD